MFNLKKLGTRWGLIFLLVVSIGASAFGIAATVAIPTPTGLIHGCYATNNGALRVVESPSECKANELAIRWNQTGPTGPQGPQGPTGPQGPAGQARAAGSVFPGTPQFYTHGLTGWVGVERSSVGTYCLTPDPSITSSNSVLMLSLGSPGATSLGQVVWTGYCSTAPLQYQVQTLDNNGNLSNAVYFTAMVP